MNGGVCSSRKHCLCPPGFTGRLCQFPLQQMQQAQAARGNKQPVYPISLKPDSLKLGEQSGIGRTQMTQTHSFFTQVGHHSSEGIYYFPQFASEVFVSWFWASGLVIHLSSLSLFSVQINLHVHHTPDTSVVIQPLDQPHVKLPHKTGPRLIPSRHKPKGRCFQETTPKQAVSSDRCRDGRPAQCFEVSFSTDNAHLSYLASVQQHAASCSDQSGGLLRQCGKLMGTKQVLSVPQTAEWVLYKSWRLFCFNSLVPVL